MATYPVEFHRRLEQKWESRIEQILSVTGKVPPPRRPNDDDDEMQTVPKFHRGPLGWRTPEGTYNDRPFMEALQANDPFDRSPTVALPCARRALHRRASEPTTGVKYSANLSRLSANQQMSRNLIRDKRRARSFTATARDRGILS